MIVDFEQDPAAPFGVGNFRDDAGRYTYANDPETAKQFVTTMAGPGKVAAESTAIAKQAMGGAAPVTGPDMRTAQAAPTPDSGQAATAGIAATQAATASLEQKLDAPTTGQAPPGGKGAALVGMVNQVSPAPGAGPGAPQAPATGPGATLVKAATAAAPATPTAPPAQALPPVSGVTQSRSRSVVKGASRQGVQARINADNATQTGLERQMLDSAQGKDERVAAAIQNEYTATQAAGGEAMGEIDQASRKEAEAARLEQAKRAELKKNDESLDPERTIRNMSTGKKIGMVILAALNGGFGALIGQKSNGVLDVIDAEIERDIDRQKQEIASGRIRIGNEIDKYVKQGFDAQTAERLARDRMKAAIGKLTELESKRLLVEGENEENARMMVAQNQAGRARWQGDLWATTEDREQTQDSEQVQREVPKPVAGGSALEMQSKELEYRIKELDYINKSNAAKDAYTRSVQLFGTEKVQRDDGTVVELPKKLLTPDQIKDIDARVKEVSPLLAQTAGAVEMTRQLGESLGATLDVTNGTVTWATTKEKVDGKMVDKPADMPGVGYIDSRGGWLGALPGVGHLTDKLRAEGIYRTPYDVAKEKQDALKQFVTSDMTGANSSLRQDQVFGAMVGGDLSNEAQTKAAYESWVATLFAKRKEHMNGLGPDGQQQWYINQRASNKGVGADVPDARPEQPMPSPLPQSPTAPDVPPPPLRQPQPATVAAR